MNERELIAARINEDYEFTDGVQVDPGPPGYNRNFVARIADTPFHVRVYRPSTPALAIKAELLALDELRNARINVCAAIMRADGSLSGDIALPDGTYEYAVFEFASGSPPQQWTVDLAEQVGRTVACIHAVIDASTIDLTDRPSLSAQQLATEPIATLMSGDPDRALAGRLKSVAEEIVHAVSALGHDVPANGFIHADLHAMNMHVDEDGAARIFDFDSSSIGPRAFDLAVCWMTVTPTHWPRFLRGYMGVRTVTEDDLMAVRPLATARMVRDCAESVRDGGPPGGYWSYDRLAEIIGRIDALPPPTSRT